MLIRLEKMIPLPLLEQNNQGSEVWEADPLVFEPGRSYVIEAPSGKGKTSLLSMIYGLRDDYRGVIRLDARDIRQVGRREWSELRKRSLSYIFQGLELFSDLTALENIELKNSITRQMTPQRIRELSLRLGFADHLNRKAGILSFGQQQRVAILRALCQPFDFLLADECFSHIDTENSLAAYEVIREECKLQGAGLILTSLNGQHFVEQAVRLKL